MITNVPLDLAQGVGDVADALDVIRGRIAGARLIAPPTVALELAYLSEFADEDDVRSAAQTALRSLTSQWGIQPVNLVPVGHGIVDAIAAKIRAQGLLPDEETHDALILAESAILECSVLIRLRDRTLAGERSPVGAFRPRACQPSSEACPEVTLHPTAFRLLPYFVTQPDKQGMFDAAHERRAFAGD